jgi:chromosome segregation ATPase
LATELERMVKDQTSHLAVDLEDAHASLDLIVEENERLRAAFLEADAQLACSQLSVAEQHGTLTALRAQIDVFTGQLEAAKSEAESVRHELVLSREQLRALDERCLRAESERVAQHAELAVARQELQKTREEVQSARRDCIKFQTNLAAAEKSSSSAQSLQAALEDARTRLSASEAERSGLAARLEDTRLVLARAESSVQKLLGKVLASSSGEEGE